jgi:hypothetical protein
LTFQPNLMFAGKAIAPQNVDPSRQASGAAITKLPFLQNVRMGPIEQRILDTNVKKQ